MRKSYDKKVFVSREIVKGAYAKKANGVKFYSQAHAIDGHPSWYSKVINLALKVDENDPRINKLGRILNIPKERRFSKKAGK